MIDWNIQQFEKFTRIWNWFWKCSKLWPLRCLYVYNYATDKIYARSVMFVMSNIWPHDAIKSSHRYKSVCLSIGYLAWVLYVYEVMGQTCFTNRSINSDCTLSLAILWNPNCLFILLEIHTAIQIYRIFFNK